MSPSQIWRALLGSPMAACHFGPDFTANCCVLSGALNTCTMEVSQVEVSKKWDSDPVRGQGTIPVVVVDAAVAHERKAALVAIGADGVHARQALCEMAVHWRARDLHITRHKSAATPPRKGFAAEHPMRAV